MAIKRWARGLCFSRVAVNDAGPTIAMQVMSDLHLEIGRSYQTFDITPRAPYLLLAGNVGRLQDYDLYCEFLQRQCARFKHVCLILGNLEFFGLSRTEGLTLAESLQAEPGLCQKLKILNRTRFDLTPRITILGCTLQPYLQSQARDTIQQKVSEFVRISRWTVNDHNSEHRSDVRWVSMVRRLLLLLLPFASTVLYDSAYCRLANLAVDSGLTVVTVEGRIGTLGYRKQSAAHNHCDSPCPSAQAYLEAQLWPRSWKS